MAAHPGHETTYRPLTDEERRDLEHLASGKADLGSDFTLFGCLSVLILLPGLWLLDRLDWSGPLPAAVLFALLLVVLFRVRRKLKRGLESYRALHAADLEDGRAEVDTYAITDALRVEEFEDEGSSYYLRLANDRVLFLSGQYLYEPEEEGVFPSSRVRTARAVKSRLLLDIECLGEPVAVRATLPPFTGEEHARDGVPDDGDITDETFEKLVP